MWQWDELQQLMLPLMGRPRARGHGPTGQIWPVDHFFITSGLALYSKCGDTLFGSVFSTVWDWCSKGTSPDFVSLPYGNSKKSKF